MDGPPNSSAALSLPDGGGCFMNSFSFSGSSNLEGKAEARTDILMDFYASGRFQNPCSR